MGKSQNPTDAYRKQQRKKEIKKNKKDRKQVREFTALVKNPDALSAEIERLEKEESEGMIDRGSQAKLIQYRRTQKDQIRKKRLLEMHEAKLEEKKERIKRKKERGSRWDLEPGQDGEDKGEDEEGNDDGEGGPPTVPLQVQQEQGGPPSGPPTLPSFPTAQGPPRPDLLVYGQAGVPPPPPRPMMGAGPRPGVGMPRPMMPRHMMPRPGGPPGGYPGMPRPMGGMMMGPRGMQMMRPGPPGANMGRPMMPPGPHGPPRGGPMPPHGQPHGHYGPGAGPGPGVPPGMPSQQPPPPPGPPSTGTTGTTGRAGRKHPSGAGIGVDPLDPEGKGYTMRPGRAQELEREELEKRAIVAREAAQRPQGPTQGPAQGPTQGPALGPPQGPTQGPAMPPGHRLGAEQGPTMPAGPPKLKKVELPKGFAVPTHLRINRAKGTAKPDGRRTIVPAASVPRPSGSKLLSGAKNRAVVSVQQQVQVSEQLAAVLCNHRLSLASFLFLTLLFLSLPCCSVWFLFGFCLVFVWFLFPLLG
ncbi:unnamed protein product [Chrysoparadoxa australica]